MLDAAQKRAGGIPGSQDKAGGSIGGRSPETKERAENPKPDYAERSRWRPPGQEGSLSQGQGSLAKVRGTETRASRRKGKNPDDERDKESAGRTDMTQARLASFNCLRPASLRSCSISLKTALPRAVLLCVEGEINKRLGSH